MSFLAKFSTATAQLVPRLRSDVFPSMLAKYFKQLAALDNVVIITYPSKKLPRIEHNDLPSGQRASTIDRFVKGAFLQDPYYLAATKKNQRGFYQLNQLAPSGFDHSEYYRTYYKSSGLIDECGYLIQLGDTGKNFVNISLGRISMSAPFSAEQLLHFSEITPLVEALVTQHWHTEDFEFGTQKDLRGRLEAALEYFGKSMLTERESQMVQMILHGYSTKAISSRLSISVETVKLHRKNAYAKLDISTQGELFHLFIDSLMSIDNYEGGDPLIPYQSAITARSSPS